MGSILSFRSVDEVWEACYAYQYSFYHKECKIFPDNLTSCYCCGVDVRRDLNDWEYGTKDNGEQRIICLRCFELSEKHSLQDIFLLLKRKYENDISLAIYEAYSDGV
jgi:hypothetical protein